MHQSHDIVQGPAVFRRKVRRLGVEEAQRDDQVGDTLEGLVDRSIPDAGLPRGLQFEQIRYLPGVDSSGVGVYRDFRAVGDGRRSVFEADDGGDGELPRE